MKQMVLAVTPGDPDGIGPEILWKVLRRGKYKSSSSVNLLCVGARKPFEKLGAPIVEYKPGLIPKRKTPYIWLCSAPVKRTSHLSGFQSGWSIKKAVQLVQGGNAAALVTGPISKERLRKAGFRFFGHTDFLAQLCKSKVTMMLANKKLRVSLVTTHLPLNRVAKHIDRKKIKRTVEHTVQFLRINENIRRPRIAIAALNPHAGERGELGLEEIKIIAPEIRLLSKKLRNSCSLVGPLPADTLFTQHSKYDAVVCMYHDQGLIPVKMLDFSHTVNVTLGLPFVRTSVDHGVAFDIAGKGIADPKSLECAIELAIRLVS